MSRPDARPEVDDRRAGRDEAGAPDDAGGRMACRNDGPEPVAFSVVRRRGGRSVVDCVVLDPDEVVALPLPEGAGPIAVDVRAADTLATTTVADDASTPLFVYRGDAVLVVRD